MDTPTLELTQKLICEPSITPIDANCQQIIAQRLQQIGFVIEHMPFDEVKNLYAKRGDSDPVLLFAGHTDVVPTGPIEKWTSPPFQPSIRNGYLYGRGATDMKGSLAAMICACENFIAENAHHNGSIAFLITSDEEGPSLNGTKRVVQQLLARKEKITWCIVGEPSSEKKLGDVIKVGRRGSLNGKLTIFGKQGHIAYPQKADNPISKSLPALNELCTTLWDKGNVYFSPTSFQISNLNAGTGANNVIPDSLEVIFNFRFSTEVTAQKLQERVHAILEHYKLQYQLDWHISGEPFSSHLGPLYQASCQAIESVTGTKPHSSTDGGTSDGRFIIKTGCELIELGPCNDSIHQINEHISIEDLNLLTQIYQKILVSLLGNG